MTDVTGDESCPGALLQQTGAELRWGQHCSNYWQMLHFLACPGRCCSLQSQEVHGRFGQQLREGSVKVTCSIREGCKQLVSIYWFSKQFADRLQPCVPFLNFSDNSNWHLLLSHAFPLIRISVCICPLVKSDQYVQT